ncbi:MAG: amidohydrolase family protein [Acidobacteriota bacterium]|nr:amidohydrolase family protein [Acidobacteriota bacterium]
MRSILAVPVILLSTLITGIAPAQQPPVTSYIRAGHLFDPTTGQYADNITLVIANQRVKSIEPAGFVPPAGSQLLDLSADYVLPGLIDCHTHLSSRADSYEEILSFTKTPYDAAIGGVVNAKKTLEAGFTTVRDVGSPAFLAVDLRKNIDAGYIPGPRMVASGPGLSITGGHGDLNNYSPETSVTLFPTHRDFRIADGPEEVRQTIREQVKYGVDVIKIMASGGVLSKGDQPGAPQYTLEELKVAADTAHQAGRKIAAHAHGAQSIKWAIEAGIDSIEHASLVDDEGIALAKAHGTYFVMDIYNDDYILQVGPKIGMTEELLNKERGVGQAQRNNFRKAHAAGVKMAFGTDAGVYPHGDNAKQFHYMVLYGMTPTEAIRAATTSAADLIGRSADVGSLTPGHFADLIAVPSDPLQKIEVLEHIETVVKGGVLVKGK